MNSVTTKKGSVLPLLKLKGKDYLQVAHRLQWLADDYENYEITSDAVSITEDAAVFRTTVTIYNNDGKVVRKATGTKKETKKDFPDFIEKAETGALGRALAMVGLGTQHAIADLDEGERLADAPVPNVKVIGKPAPLMQEVPSSGGEVITVTDTPKKFGFSNRLKTTSASAEKVETDDGF